MSLIDKRVTALENENTQSNADKDNFAKIKEKQSFKKWLENFWYHYKTAIIFSLLGAIILGYGIYLWPKNGKSDLSVAIITYGSLLSEQQGNIKTKMEQFTPDVNQDGKSLIELRDIPILENEGNSDVIAGAQSVVFNTQQQQKIAVNLNDSKVVVYILDEITYNNLSGKLRLKDLSAMYPGNDKIIDDVKLIFKKTALSESLNVEGVETGDLYICIRDFNYVKDNDKSDIKLNYDKSMELIDNLIKSNP